MVQKVERPCPVCGKGTIQTLFYPSVLQTKTSGGSGVTAKITFRTEEKYEVMDKCPECGTSKSKIQKVLDGKMSPEEARGEKKKTNCMRCGKELINIKVRMCDECDAWYKTTRGK